MSSAALRLVQVRLTRLDDAVFEYVTEADAVAQCRLVSGNLLDAAAAAEQSANLARWIRGARYLTENTIFRQIGRQRLRLKLPEWPSNGVILLPRPPLLEVERVAYTDSEGVTTAIYDTLASPLTDDGTLYFETETEPGFIGRKRGKSWPSATLAFGFPITVDFWCGLEAPDDDLIDAMLLAVAHWQEHREAVVIGNTAQINAVESATVPLGFERLLDRWIAPHP